MKGRVGTPSSIEYLRSPAQRRNTAQRGRSGSKAALRRTTLRNDARKAGTFTPEYRQWLQRQLAKGHGL